jgi:hypothetical protein
MVFRRRLVQHAGWRHFNMVLHRYIPIGERCADHCGRNLAVDVPADRSGGFISSSREFVVGSSSHGVWSFVLLQIRSRTQVLDRPSRQKAVMRRDIVSLREQCPEVNNAEVNNARFNAGVPAHSDGLACLRTGTSFV